MALSNLRTDWMFGTTYAMDRDYFIKIVENRALYDNPTTTSHIHGAGDNHLPTIGYGYDLTERPWPEINAFLRGLLGTLSADQEEAMELIEFFKQPAAATVVIEDASQNRTTRHLSNADINSGATGSSGSSVVVTENGVERLIPLNSLASIELTEAQSTTLIEGREMGSECILAAVANEDDPR